MQLPIVKRLQCCKVLQLLRLVPLQALLLEKHLCILLVLLNPKCFVRIGVYLLHLMMGLQL